MRRDLVEAALGAASALLFEDVIYTPVAGGAPTLLTGAIFGVEVAAERFEMFGESLRAGTHIARGVKAKFPGLAKGDLIDNGIAYRVLDWEPIGDGRFEFAISLAVA